MSYEEDAKSDAADMAEHFLADLVVQLGDKGCVEKHLIDDAYDYRHENYIDRDYSLTEAATILEELHKHKETDSGLWQSLEPVEAVCCQAAYTYGNAVSHGWQEIMKLINKDAETGILKDMLGTDDPADAEVVSGRVQEIIQEYK